MKSDAKNCAANVDEIDAHATKFINSLKTTAAARFNASRRLEGRSRLINLMLALLSSSVIITSVLPMVYEFTRSLELLIFFVGLAAAIFVVVLSLYQWSSKDDVNAEKLHQAGLKISELRRTVNLAHLSRFDSESTTPLDGWFENAVTQYNEILRECGINHSDVDYISVKIESIKTGGFKIGSRISHRISQMSQEMSALFIVSLIVFAFVIDRKSVV